MVGPLGQATKIEKVGTVVCCGGGVGVAPLLPIIRAMKQVGNRVVSVLAGRTKDLIILEDEVRRSSDEVVIMTDDGSYGQKGLVTEGVEQVIDREKVDQVVTIGPAVMMKFVALLTKIRHPYRLLAQHHHGRRHRHVWCLSGYRRRPYALRLHRRAGI